MLFRRRRQAREPDSALAEDPLTGLPSSHRVAAELRRSVAIAKRFGNPLALLLIEVDGDDSALRAVGEVLTSSLREVDLPGRWGDNRFAVVLPYVDADGATVVARRIEERVPVPVIVRSTQWHGEDAEQLVAEAERALGLGA